MQRGGEDVFRRDRIAGDETSLRIGLADDSAARDASASKRGRIDAGPMMSSSSDRFAVDLRSAAMFRDAEHERLVQQSAFVQIADQCRVRLIEDRQQILL